MKKLIILGLGILLSMIMLLITPFPALAINSQPQNVSETIDHFLTSLPKNYYTIRTTKALKRITKRNHALLIDVRKPSEYASGHIPNAINVPLKTLTHNLDKIPQDRPVILYCTTGYRSAMGVMTLRMLGYNNVKAFPPSLQGWQAAGEPLEK